MNVRVVSGLLLLAVAIAHLLRVVFSVSLVIGGWAAPEWMSIVAIAGAGALGAMLLRPANRS